MKKIIILFLLICLVAITGCTQQTTQYVEPHITGTICDAETACPQGLSCYNLGDGPICIDENPCEWYCNEGQECLILESDPPHLGCNSIDEPEEETEEELVEEIEEETEEEVSTISCDEEIQLFIEQSFVYEGTFITLQSVATDAVVFNIEGEYESLEPSETKDFDGVIIRLDEVYPRTEETEDSVVLTILCEAEEEIPYFLDSFGNAIACDESAGIKIDDTLNYNDISIYLDSMTSSEANLKIDGFLRTLTVGEQDTTENLELTLEGIYSRTNPAESYVSFKISC
jgi:hypothetical protein